MPKNPPPKNSNQKSQVRIIGGTHKRRLIDFVAVDGLRPTPDRLRETLFNWLMHDLHGASVLDVCAGSGVLAFESLSRGADFATLIEYNKAQAAQLQHSAQTLKLTNAHIIHGDCLTVIPTLNNAINTPFHIVFIDPPYSLNLWQAILDQLIAHQFINGDTLVYIESDKPIDAIVNTPMTMIKETKVGGVLAYLCQLA